MLLEFNYGELWPAKWQQSCACCLPFNWTPNQQSEFLVSPCICVLLCPITMAHIRSWLHHTLCKSSGKTSTSYHKSSVFAFVSSCITLHFPQRLKLVFWDFLNFVSLLFVISNSPFSFAFARFFTPSHQRLLSCCHCCHICLLVMPFTAWVS